MPVHDWTRVTAGTFHAFHNAWITHLQEALNDHVLPSDYYALGEQRSGDIGPDVLLFLTPAHYVNIPLEETYMFVWQGIPERWRRVIEASESSRG